MSVTLTVSDKTFQVDDLPVQDKAISDEEVLRRKESVKRIRELQKRLSEKYGVMQDSTPLIREDRER